MFCIYNCYVYQSLKGESVIVYWVSKLYHTITAIEIYKIYNAGKFLYLPDIVQNDFSS